MILFSLFIQQKYLFNVYSVLGSEWVVKYKNEQKTLLFNMVVAQATLIAGPTNQITLTSVDKSECNNLLIMGCVCTHPTFVIFHLPSLYLSRVLG